MNKKEGICDKILKTMGQSQNFIDYLNAPAKISIPELVFNVTVIGSCIGSCIGLFVYGGIKQKENPIQQEAPYVLEKIIEDKNCFLANGYDARLYISNRENQLTITPKGKLDSVSFYKTFVEAHFNKDNIMNSFSYFGSRFDTTIKSLSDSNLVRKVYDKLLSEKQVDSVYTKIR